MPDNNYNNSVNKSIWSKMREVIMGQEKVIEAQNNGRDGYLPRKFTINAEGNQVLDWPFTQTYWKCGVLLPFVNSYRDSIMGKIFSEPPTFEYYLARTDSNGDQVRVAENTIPRITNFQECCSSSSLSLVDLLRQILSEVLLVGEVLVLVTKSNSNVDSEYEVSCFKVEQIMYINYFSDGKISDFSASIRHDEYEDCVLNVSLIESRTTIRYYDSEEKILGEISLDMDYIPAFVATMDGCKTEDSFAVPFLLNTANLALASFCFSADIGLRSRLQASPASVYLLNDPSKIGNAVQHAGAKVLYTDESFEYKELAPSTLTSLSEVLSQHHRTVMKITGEDLSGSSERMSAEALSIVERSCNNKIMVLVDGLSIVAEKIISLVIEDTRTEISVTVRMNRRIGGSQLSTDELNAYLSLHDRGLLDYGTYSSALQRLGITTESTEFNELQSRFERSNSIGS